MNTITRNGINRGVRYDMPMLKNPGQARAYRRALIDCGTKKRAK